MTPPFTNGTLCCALLLSCFSIAHAREGSYAYQMPEGGTAVDVKGVRHSAREYPNHHAPWNFSDRVVAAAPIYPYADRVNRNQGRGFFRIAVDPKTGIVTQVGIVRSTGYPSLDKAAVASLRRWRYKPGKWKEVEVPVTFEMGVGGKPNIPSGAIPLSH